MNKLSKLVIAGIASVAVVGGAFVAAGADDGKQPSLDEVLEKSGGKIYIPGPDTDPTDPDTAIGYFYLEDTITEDGPADEVPVYDPVTDEEIGVNEPDVGFVPE